MALKTGILVIGSLYWDDSQTRIDWRNSHLEFDNQQNVFVPIRYGRKSLNRGNTYTMVFSRLCFRRSHGLGTGKAISLRRPIETLDQLIEEAEFLWAAERNSSNTNGRITASWGCVALLINPASQIPPDLIESWKKRVAQETCYGEIPHTKSEGEVVTAQGFLNIPWPRLSLEETTLPMDMLLATATKPTLTGDSSTYPRIREIAQAWKRDSRNKKYFLRNYENGIRTFQDDALLTLLQ